MNIYEQFKTPFVFCGAVVVFILLLFIVPEHFISTDLGNTVLTISTFLYGIIAGFFIVVTTTDYNTLKNLVAAETGGLIALHQNVLMYDKEAAAHLEELIDGYIRNAFDTELINSAQYIRPDFEKIKKLVRELPVKEELSEILQQIRVIMDSLITVHQNEIVLSTRTVSTFQWFVLMVLSALPIVTIYGLRTGEIFFDIVTVAFSSMVILILLIIRAIDLYVWNEETFSFNIYEEVLESIGKLPYYPQESIQKGRVHPQWSSYRIGMLEKKSGRGERKIEVINK